MFQRNSKPAPTNVATNDKWKSAAFIKLYMVNGVGEEKKLGDRDLGLRVSVEAEAELAEWLLADPANVEEFKQRLIIKVVDAQPKSSASFLAPKA